MGGVGGQEMNSLALFMRLLNKHHQRETSIATLRDFGDSSHAAYAVSGETVLTEAACNESEPTCRGKAPWESSIPLAWPGMLK